MVEEVFGDVTFFEISVFQVPLDNFFCEVIVWGCIKKIAF